MTKLNSYLSSFRIIVLSVNKDKMKRESLDFKLSDTRFQIINFFFAFLDTVCYK